MNNIGPNIKERMDETHPRTATSGNDNKTSEIMSDDEVESYDEDENEEDSDNDKSNEEEIHTG